MSDSSGGAVVTLADYRDEGTRGAAAQAANLVSVSPSSGTWTDKVTISPSTTAVWGGTTWVYPPWGSPYPHTCPQEHHHHYHYQYGYPWLVAGSGEKPSEVVRRAVREIAEAVREIERTYEEMGAKLDRRELEEAVLQKLREAL